MTKKLIRLAFSIATTAIGAAAQTTVTTSGTTTSGTVPVFSGTSAVTNSPITVSNGNVGIGTTTPGSKLDIIGSNGTGVSIEPGNGTTIFGTLGFNREAATGNILAPKGFAYQFSNYNDHLQLEVYRGDGTSLGNAWVVSSSGNVGIGTTSPQYTLDVSGSIHAATALYLPDGSKQTTAWTGVLCGGDYAESVDVAGERRKYEAGDVLLIDAQNPDKFAKAAEPYSTGVAGVFSTKPGALGRRQTTPKSADEIPLAVVGIVPVKVTAENGPIRPRDLLVSSPTPGYAMKGTDRGRMLGAVIGKAMGSLDSGTGVIEVLVTLQ